MTTLALLLLLLAAAAPLLHRPALLLVADPVLPVAVLAGLLLAGAAAAAAAADEVEGWQRGAAAVLAVLAAVVAGSHAVRATFRLTRGEVLPSRARTRGTEPVPRDPGAEEPLDLEAPGSVLRGGAWIGYLERAAVAGTLLAGFPEGLALVLAVKGVGRYPELRDSGRDGRSPDAPEEFIIGTLASLLWAAAATGTSALLR